MGRTEKKLIELPRIEDIEGDEYEVKIEEKEWVKLIKEKKGYFLEVDTSLIFKKDEGEQLIKIILSDEFDESTEEFPLEIEYID